MTIDPFFSIVTVSWQDLPGLRATGQSLDDQTEESREWIVVDGGSTDGSAEWLASQPDARCRWSSARDDGTYDAMNIGLNRCSGRFVLFLNAGDRLASRDVLRFARERIEEHPRLPDFVYGDSIDVQSTGEELYRPARSHAWIGRGMFTSHQAMFFGRHRRPDLRYDLCYPTSADYAYVASFVASNAQQGAAECLYLPLPLCKFSLGGKHFVHRQAGMLEDYSIRRTVLKQPLPVAATLFAAHQIHHLLKLAAPAFTRRLRYTSRA